MVAVGVCLLIYLCFIFIDVPLAQYVWTFPAKPKILKGHLDGPVILEIEVALVMALLVSGVLIGKVPRVAKVTFVACAASISAYAINIIIFKPLFGIPNPGDVLAGAQRTVHWFGGAESSSFPSGHMMISASFVSVIAQNYRVPIWLITSVLIAIGVILIAGNWHFLSDVIAGAWLGLLYGQAIGRYWSKLR